MKFNASDRESYVFSGCAACIFDVAVKYLRMALTQNLRLKDTEEYKKEEVTGVKALLSELNLLFCPEMSPNEIAQIMFRKAAQLAGMTDAWEEIRTQSNRIALELRETVLSQLNQILDPKERIYRAILWSVVGNTIDYGTAGHEVSISHESLITIFEKTKENGFKINNYHELWSDLQENKSCLYICDNAGEIVFDRIVIEELIRNGIAVTAVVKGGPISNDAIISDAHFIGLDQICPVITTGSPDLGFFPAGNSPEFIERLKESKIVIAKGQANWEGIYAYQDQLPKSIIFYSIATLKCDVHANLFGFPKGSNILYRVDRMDFKNGRNSFN
jgi:uncharacterized protein with ATP-grasp and redox domains